MLVFLRNFSKIARVEHFYFNFYHFIFLYIFYWKSKLFCCKVPVSFLLLIFIISKLKYSSFSPENIILVRQIFFFLNHWLMIIFIILKNCNHFPLKMLIFSEHSNTARIHRAFLQFFYYFILLYIFFFENLLPLLVFLQIHSKLKYFYRISLIRIVWFFSKINTSKRLFHNDLPFL